MITYISILQCHLELIQLIPATHLPVDPMQYATGSVTLDPANAFLSTLETLMWPADRSVLFTLTAPQTKPAREISASTHAPVPVASMPSARCGTTSQPAPAFPTILETPSLHAA